jgi:TrmH family RNA methyltransferase
MHTITSRRHPLVLACREARGGGDDQPLLLDGWHLLAEAVGHVAVDTVAIGPAPLSADEARTAEQVEEAGAHVVRVTDDVLQAMSPVRTPTGVVALARRPHHALGDVLARGAALVAVAVDVQDPGNVGTLVRTAEAAGATAFVAAGSTADPYGWKALRAAMGSAFRVPIAHEPDAARVVDQARARALHVYALVPRDGLPPSTVDLRQPTCLLLGSEGQGLPTALVAAAEARIAVPMQAPVESLNVAVAGALVLYAAAAQRGDWR